VSTFVLTGVNTWVGGHDFTCDTNEASLGIEVDEQENTTFCSGGWRSRIGGLRSVSADLSGFWQAGSAQVDPDTFTTLGTGGEVVTISPTGVAASAAYLFKGGKFSYEMLGSVGEVAPFSLNIMGTEGSEGLVRGQVAAAKQNVSATGLLGSVLTDLSSNDQVSSSQYLYAVLHVFSVGTTITVQVQSDDSAGFGSPTTRGTFGPITTTGGTWLTRVAGPITDTHYRLNVSAITGTFSVAGAIAIQ
jgi:hypothetical protein